METAVSTKGDDRPGGVGRRFRRVARLLLPPFIVEAARRVSNGRPAPGPSEWEYLPRGWPEDDASIRGWDTDSVAETQLARWPAFVHTVEGAAPFGLTDDAVRLPTEDEYGRHNTVMTFGYVLARATLGRDRLTMLDWGGGIGRYCIYAKALLPEVELEYHSRDLPLLTRAGRQVLPGAIFHDDDDDALAGTYDLVLASGSLQYARDWRTMLGRLATATAGYLFVTRQPFVASTPSYVVIQRPHRLGYQTEYAGWFLNRGEFLDAARALGLHLEREFLVDERPTVVGAPEQGEYRGFLFSLASGRRGR